MNSKVAIALVTAFLAGAWIHPFAARSEGKARVELECAEPPGINGIRNLNKLMAQRAAEGWDLVGVSGVVACFRRPTH